MRRAGNGRPGSGINRNGAEGDDLVLTVPDGTVVKTAGGEELADLTGAGTRYVAADGGRGGLGNAALASTKRKAPGFALRGEPGDELNCSCWSSRPWPTRAWSASPMPGSPR